MVVEKESNVSWTSRSPSPGEVGPAEPLDETVINAAPYDGRKPTRCTPEDAGTPDGHRDADIAEEIKPREISLAARTR